jgi:photosystem II stability/assembly factor-like uncharacterized protein
MLNLKLIIKPKKMKKKTLMIIISIMLMAVAAKPQMWLTQNVNPVDEGYNFTCLSVVDSNTVLGIGYLSDQVWPDHYSYLSRTLDGGDNWSSTPLDTDWWVSSFQALNADTLWISTISQSGTSAGYPKTAIRKSTDGGQTWMQNTLIPFVTTDYCDFVHFFNDTDGVAFGDVNNGAWEVFYTTDGGVEWNTADSISAPLSGEMGLENSQYVFGDYIWVASSQGRIFFTHDKGHNWLAATIGAFSYPDGFRIAFYNMLEGLAVRYNMNTSLASYVYRTHDGGKTWSQISHNGPVYQSYPAGGLFIVPGSNIVIANGGGSSYNGSVFSADSGATWTAIDFTNRYGALDGKGWNTLWAGQYSNTIGVGGVAKWDGAFLGIKELSLNADFLIYPNPCNGKLNISCSGNISDLEITNLLGQTIYKANPAANNFSLQLDDTGIYFIRATFDKHIITKKFIVCH